MFGVHVDNQRLQAPRTQSATLKSWSHSQTLAVSCGVVFARLQHLLARFEQPALQDRDHREQNRNRCSRASFRSVLATRQPGWWTRAAGKKRKILDHLLAADRQPEYESHHQIPRVMKAGRQPETACPQVG